MSVRESDMGTMTTTTRAVSGGSASSVSGAGSSFGNGLRSKTAAAGAAWTWRRRPQHRTELRSGTRSGFEFEFGFDPVSRKENLIASTTCCFASRGYDDGDGLNLNELGEGSASSSSRSGSDFDASSEDMLSDPKAVVLCGFRPEECAQFRMLLDELGGRHYKVLPCTSEGMRGTVGNMIFSEEVDWEQPRSKDLTFPSPGSPRCVLFCGLPREEIDIVTAVMDESKVQPFAVAIVTRNNVDEILGKVVVAEIKNQEDLMSQRKEFMSWKSSLVTPEDSLSKPIFREESAKSTFSSALRESNAGIGMEVEESSSSETVETDGEESSLSDGIDEGDERARRPLEGEEEIAKGFYSKPLDLDGVRRDLAQDMQDDKAFMDPWYARGMEPDESRDIMKEEEKNFIQKCLKMQSDSNVEVKNETAEKSLADQTDDETSLDDIILSSTQTLDTPERDIFVRASEETGEATFSEAPEESRESPAENLSLDSSAGNKLSKEDILEITKKFENVDDEMLDGILERYKRLEGEGSD